MAVTTKRSVIINYSGDLSFAQEFRAADYVTLPVAAQIRDLSVNGNTVVPMVPGVKSVTIIPPTGNTNFITVKGAATDVGFNLNNVDPTSIALQGSTVITLSTEIPVTVKLVYT